MLLGNVSLHLHKYLLQCKNLKLQKTLKGHDGVRVHCVQQSLLLRALEKREAER